jgi:putative tricarboxylic transport membrane protein
VNRDGALGLLLLVLAAGYYAAADAIPPSTLADAGGPGGLPKVYAVVLGVLALGLVARARRRDAAGPVVSGRLLWRVAGLLGLGLLYLFAVEWVGYPLGIAGLLIGTTYHQGGRLDRRVAVVGAAGAVVLWLLFALVLGIQVPAGAWLDALRGEP